MPHDLKPCTNCNGTGFSDRVNRGAWAMQPREKICPACDGRGWVPTTNFADTDEYARMRHGNLAGGN